jgi:glycosyltransferase involved in cell wall biosynthesis
LTAKKIIIIGPAYPYRGGMATFNERMAREFQQQGHAVTIYTFTLQYPSFFFPGKSQFSNDSAPENIHILRKINTINPFNWWKTGRELYRLKPELIIVRFWLPLIGPALGSILKIAKKNNHSRVIALTDNIIPHEKRPGDTPFTRYFLSACDAFVTMSHKVMNDLRKLESAKPAIQVVHPLYDNFGTPVDKTTARKKTGIPPHEAILLFFGFIRKYKGLDILLEAVHLLKNRHWQPNGAGWKLVVAGEFYEDREKYKELISRLQIDDQLILRTDFISNDEVKYYFSAADVVLQPYRDATQSGVTPLAYHFDKPMIVSNVGALPDYVPHEKAGLVAEPNPESLASAIVRYFELGEEYFILGLQKEKSRYSWSILTNEIIKLSDSLRPVDDSGRA